MAIDCHAPANVFKTGHLTIDFSMQGKYGVDMHSSQGIAIYISFHGGKLKFSSVLWG